jgi:hypothetical protein
MALNGNGSDDLQRTFYGKNVKGSPTPSVRNIDGCGSDDPQRTDYKKSTHLGERPSK